VELKLRTGSGIDFNASLVPTACVRGVVRDSLEVVAVRCAKTASRKETLGLFGEEAYDTGTV
jgi:hypothetical protein